MKRAALIVFLFVVVALGVTLGAQQVKGQKPVALIGDAFQWTDGAWGTYTLYDKKEKSYYTMTMSILESVRKSKKDAAWMEVDIETVKERVVTRMLAEKTPKGPGEPMEAIVWVEGLDPFKVPNKYLKGDKKEVGQFETGQVTRRVEQRKVTFDGTPLEIVDVEAADAQGHPITAVVSTAVAPICVLIAETVDMSMYLEAWGGGAKTRVKGSPRGFTLWLFDLIGRGMSGEDVGLKDRAQRTFPVAGTWMEREGPCTGSTWAISGTRSADLRVMATSRCEGRATVETQAGAATWRTDKVAEMTLGGRSAEPAKAMLIFPSPEKAVVVFTAPNGRPALATLTRETT